MRHGPCGTHLHKHEFQLLEELGYTSVHVTGICGSYYYIEFPQMLFPDFILILSLKP